MGSGGIRGDKSITVPAMRLADGRLTFARNVSRYGTLPLNGGVCVVPCLRFASGLAPAHRSPHLTGVSLAHADLNEVLGKISPGGPT